MISELHMWLTFGVIAGAMLLYVTELVAIEMTSLLALVVMLLLFTLFPQIGPDGTNLLDATALWQALATRHSSRSWHYW